MYGIIATAAWLSVVIVELVIESITQLELPHLLRHTLAYICATSATLYTVIRKKTPTHVFFYISVENV